MPFYKVYVCVYSENKRVRRNSCIGYTLYVCAFEESNNYWKSNGQVVMVVIVSLWISIDTLVTLRYSAPYSFSPYVLPDKINTTNKMSFWVISIVYAAVQTVNMYTCIHVRGLESHLKQLIFLRKSDCLGCAVLLCLVVCLTLLASFFLPSHLSLKHVYNSLYTVYSILGMCYILW